MSNDKLYKIVDTTGWKRGISTDPLYPIVIDNQGQQYVLKGMRASRINEMIVSKACEIANFDAVKNEFACNESKQRPATISRLLDYDIEPLIMHLKQPLLAKGRVLTTPISEIFNHKHLHIDANFKKRYVDEVLLRSTFDDTDSYFHNISVKKSKQEAGTFSTGTTQPPLELSTSYDFDYCLGRKRDTEMFALLCKDLQHIEHNIEFIRKHYPQNAEKFFADFTFDSATLDKVFDLSGAPQEWYIKLRIHNGWDSEQDIANSIATINELSKNTRTIFQQNLNFMKNTYSKKKTFQTGGITPTSPHTQAPQESLSQNT